MLVAVIAAFIPAATAATASRFGPPDLYNFGAIWVVSGDFNRDGIPDLIASADAASGIYFLRGVGGGHFATAVLVGDTNDDHGGRLVAVDLNRDGILDILLSSSDAAVFYVWLGRGDGTFRQFAGTEYYSATSSGVLQQAAVADFNGDGWPDIVAVGAGSVCCIGTIQIWANNHDGTFRQVGGIAEGSHLTTVVTADLNTDGIVDFAVADINLGYVVPFYGDGHMGFQRGIPTATPDPIYMAAGDFNMDGKPDFVVSNLYENQVTELLRSDGGLYRIGAVVAVGHSPWEITPVKLVRSTPLGFVVANRDDGTATAFTGDGRGSFNLLGTYPLSAGVPGASESLESVVAPDVNGDGRPDLIGANQGDAGSVVVRLAQAV